MLTCLPQGDRGYPGELREGEHEGGRGEDAAEHDPLQPSRQPQAPAADGRSHGRDQEAGQWRQIKVRSFKPLIDT